MLYIAAYAMNTQAKCLFDLYRQSPKSLFVRARAGYASAMEVAASIEMGAPSFVAAGFEPGILYGWNLRHCRGVVCR
jgi:hypothetical protein